VAGEPSAAASPAPTSPRQALGISDVVELSPLQKHIKQLREEKNVLRKEKEQVSRALKNAEKKRMRLRQKARQLSKEDLVAVLQMRAAAGKGGGGDPAPPASRGASSGSSSASSKPPGAPADD
jgi:hypothetical protein